MKLATRIEKIEKSSQAQGAARIARAIETGDYSILTDAELTRLVGKKLEALTLEQWERGKMYMPTKQERAALQARKLCDVSHDCLLWAIVESEEERKSILAEVENAELEQAT